MTRFPRHDTRVRGAVHDVETGRARPGFRQEGVHRKVTHAKPVVGIEHDYLKQVKELLDSAGLSLPKKGRLEFRKCFGAVAGYVNGNIFVSCGKFGLAVKLPPNVLRNLFNETDVTHLKYFSKGHIKKEYAVIPPRILKDVDRFGQILDASVEYVCLKSPCS